MDKIYSRKRFLIPKIRFHKNGKRHRLLAGFGNFGNKNNSACNLHHSNNNDNNIGNKNGYNYSKNYNKNITAKIIKTSMVVIIAICIANRIITTIEPTVDVLCINMAKGIATQISNEQATVVMSNYKYDDLSSVVRDEQGKIRMIKMNIILVNEITSDVAVKIQEAINNYNKSNLYIRLGTFTGSKLLSGRGPKVEIKVSTIGNVNTDLISEFSQAGVNQTLHRIYLKVDCSISVLTPFNTKEETITNQVLLAEAVIVGDVPETYYNLNGVTSDDLMEVME